MLKRVLMTCATVGAMSGVLSAQEKPVAAPTPPAQSKAQPVAPSVEVKRRNVSIEVAISDQTGSAEPVKKVVTMVVADGRMGGVRSVGSVTVSIGQPGASVTSLERRAITLNVDASPNALPDGSVFVALTLEYMPRPEDGEKTEGPAQLNERMTVTLESGKAMVVSRAARSWRQPQNQRRGHCHGAEVGANVPRRI